MAEVLNHGTVKWSLSDDDKVTIDLDGSTGTISLRSLEVLAGELRRQADQRAEDEAWKALNGD